MIPCIKFKDNILKNEYCDLEIKYKELKNKSNLIKNENNILKKENEILKKEKKSLSETLDNVLEKLENDKIIKKTINDKKKIEEELNECKEHIKQLINSSLNDTYIYVDKGEEMSQKVSYLSYFVSKYT